LLIVALSAGEKPNRQTREHSLSLHSTIYILVPMNLTFNLCKKTFKMTFALARHEYKVTGGPEKGGGFLKGSGFLP
jgi:hypothetical protein